ncbi:NAD(P)-dependent oxidoreductase [Variovorax sp. DT-64]|uniref:NAD(P)-dependent oxidoreductase n=1 Tax=Variovorax sp. DT-64 TaxID=3396160 RepID=UPI003F1BDCFD
MHVSVIGLGSMGATLARLFLDRGHSVTLWNRSPEKATELVAAGATLVASPAQAVAASAVTVVCVYDYAAVDAILRQPEVQAALRAKVLVQLTTGSPQEALSASQWAQKHGADYLEGAIQAAPSQMGQPDTPLLLSGDAGTYRDVEDLLRGVAGNLVYLGEQIDAAATMDLATLSYVYGAYMGFMHGARLAEVRGVDVVRYGEIVRSVAPSFGAFFEHQAGVIRSGDFRISESPLRISVEATARILQASVAAGIDTQVARLCADVLQQAGAAGYGDEELAALIKVFRASPPPREHVAPVHSPHPSPPAAPARH